MWIQIHLHSEPSPTPFGWCALSISAMSFQVLLHTNFYFTLQFLYYLQRENKWWEIKNPPIYSERSENVFMEGATFEAGHERMARICDGNWGNQIHKVNFQRSVYTSRCPLVAGKQESQFTHNLKFLIHIFRSGWRRSLCIDGGLAYFLPVNAHVMSVVYDKNKGCGL